MIDETQIKDGITKIEKRLRYIKTKIKIWNTTAINRDLHRVAVDLRILAEQSEELKD